MSKCQCKVGLGSSAKVPILACSEHDLTAMQQALKKADLDEIQGYIMKNNNDWISENEERDIKRRMWNRLEQDIDHPDPTVAKVCKWIALGMIILVFGLIVAGVIRLILGLLGILPMI